MVVDIICPITPPQSALWAGLLSSLSQFVTTWPFTRNVAETKSGQARKSSLVAGAMNLQQRRKETTVLGTRFAPFRRLQPISEAILVKQFCLYQVIHYHRFYKGVCVCVCVYVCEGVGWGEVGVLQPIS